MSKPDKTLNEEFIHQILEHEEALTRRALQLFNGSTNGVEDLVQDTIVKAASNEDRFEKGTNLKAWLFVILFRLFVNRYRRKRKYQEIVSNHPATLRAYTSTYERLKSDPMSGMELDSLLDLLSVNLDDIFFEVISAVDVNGMSYKEAAVELQVPVGTVMSRLYRARRKAREVLLDTYDNAILEQIFSPETLEEACSGN